MECATYRRKAVKRVNVSSATFKSGTAIHIQTFFNVSEMVKKKCAAEV